MPKVKICGNTNPEDAALAVRLGADYLGIIFAESKRKVGIRVAADIMESVPHFKNFVAVFYNQPKQEVEAIVSELGIRWIQFHGDEPSRYCSYFTQKNYHVIKTFRIKDALSLKRIDEYDVSAFLFDTYVKNTPGGTGMPFDWRLVEDKPFIHDKLFLAGGLTPANLREAISIVQPFAVDVASGVESSAGVKDPELLAEFIRIAKEGTSYNAAEGPVSR